MTRPVATLGVFDGVHRGHAAMLSETAAWAREIGGTSVAITFNRHPEAILRAHPPRALTSLEHRLNLIEKTGIDVAIVLHFDERLARMTAEDFVKEILVDRVQAAGVVFGYNARFGYQAKGDTALLRDLGKKYGFEVRVPEPFLATGAPVSSTRVRNLIMRGELAEAAELLGRPVTLRGTVVHGDKRGATLGFPTANLNLHHEVTPPDGVYIARVRVDDKTRWGLVNIGFRPTFQRGGQAPRRTVEVYIEGYEGGGLYGRVMEVEVARYLRAERRFESSAALVEQMERDRRMLDAYRREKEAKRLDAEGECR